MTCKPTVTVQDRAVRVSVGGSGTRIKLSPSTVTKIAGHRPAASAKVSNTPVEVIDRPSKVTIGGTGTRGPKGEPGGSIPAIKFSFGDALGVRWTAEADGVMIGARIKIDAVFDSDMPEISVGTITDLDSIIPSEFVDPTKAEEFENTPDIHLSAGDSVYIDIKPDGASQGSGRLFLTFIPD